MFVKFSGSKASVDDNIKEVEKIAKRNNGGKFEFARNEAEQKLLWSARKEALWSLHAAKKEGTVLWSSDVAVPMSRFAELICEFPFSLSLNLMNGRYLPEGHEGSGNVH